MPILSNSIVTRPLTEAERAEAGLYSTTFITDTRTLRHYYRLLLMDPCNVAVEVP